MPKFTPERPSPLARLPLTRSQSRDKLVPPTPITPLQQLKKKFEHQLEKRVKINDEVSPVLYNLRHTPVKTLKEKQKILVEKHNDSRHRSDQIKVGGGFSLWPDMEKMRLTEGEIIRLLLTCLVLIVFLTFLFHKFHGSSLSNLKNFTQELRRFSSRHPLITTKDTPVFRTSVLTWHQKYRQLIRKIEKEFDMTRLSPQYQMFLFIYILSIFILIFFLIDNVFSKNKLSPRRIKNWVRLLVLVTTWSLFIFYWLFWACKLEHAVQSNVLQFSNLLGELLESDLDLDLYNNVLSYWRTRCLPPTSDGVIHILGVMPVHEVIFYLNYYSLPILTVVFTPVIKLVMAFTEIYRPQELSNYPEK